MSESTPVAMLIEKAYAAERQQDLPNALLSWEKVRSAVPTDIVVYLRIASLLVTMHRFEEADAELVSAVEQFPDNVTVAVEYARVAHICANWPEALRRWNLVRSNHPYNADGASGAGVALMHLDCLDDAEALLEDAARHFADNAHVAIEYARVAHRRGYWPEALRRWNIVQERFPGDPEGYAGAGVSMTQLDRLQEADFVLKAAVERFPQHDQLLIDYCRVAHHGRAWPEALRRWQIVRDRFPNNPEGIIGAAAALRALDRLEEWDSLVSDGVKRFPDDERLSVDYAEAACQRQDWPEAIRRWEHARVRFADNQLVVEGLGRSLFNSRRSLLDVCNDSGTVTVVAPALIPIESSPADLMLRFESLGSGCELGLVQRHFGTEPLGLLRWGAIPPLDLAKALDAGFADIGEPGNVNIFELKDSKEFFFRDTKYNLEMHTFIPARSEDHERVFMQQCRRARYLARKLIEDVITMEKIFVYKRHVGELSDQEAYPIYQALRKHGRNALLCVLPEKLPDHPGGTVEIREEGLMYGYIDGLSPTSFAPEIKYEAWLDILRMTDNLWRRNSHDRNKSNAEGLKWPL